MKKFKIFLLLFSLSFSLWSEDITDLSEHLFNCDMNIAVEILKEKNLQLDDVRFYINEESEESLEVVFIPKEKTTFHCMDLIQLDCEFTHNELKSFVFTCKCPDYNKFVKSLSNKYPSLTVEAEDKVTYYTDRSNNRKLMVIKNTAEDLLSQYHYYIIFD